LTDFFILAGGFGKRAEPLSSVLPKPMFPLNGIPLLERLTGQLVSAGLTRGWINTHHLPDKISGYPMKGAEITYVHEAELTGNRILYESRKITGNDMLVLNGDTFLKIPVQALTRALEDTSADGILLVRKKDGPYSSIIAEGDVFVRRDKDPEASDLMYTGVSLFRNSFLGKLSEENLFDSLERSGCRIAMMNYTGPWLDIGTPENYFLSDRQFRAIHHLPPGNSLSPGVQVEIDAAVSDSIIWSDSRISGDTVITGSIVTEGLHIKNGFYKRKIITPNGQFDLRI